MSASLTGPLISGISLGILDLAEKRKMPTVMHAAKVVASGTVAAGLGGSACSAIGMDNPAVCITTSAVAAGVMGECGFFPASHGFLGAAGRQALATASAEIIDRPLQSNGYVSGASSWTRSWFSGWGK